MKSFLEDMKALNLQNRTFALIENGSWACKSGDLMQKFIDEEMKNMTVLNERLSMASSLSDDKAVELDALADALGIRFRHKKQARAPRKPSFRSALAYIHFFRRRKVTANQTAR